MPASTRSSHDEHIAFDAVVRRSVVQYGKSLGLVVPFAVLAVFTVLFEANVDLVSELVDVQIGLGGVSVTTDGPADTLFGTVPDGVAWFFLLGVAMNLALVVLFGMFAVCCALIATADAEAGRSRPLDALIGRASRRLPAMVSTAFLASLLVVVGLLAFVLPGLYLLWRLAFALPAAAIDGAGPTAAIRASWTSSAGRFVPIAGVLVAATAALLVASAIPFVEEFLVTIVVLPIVSIALGVRYLEATEVS